MHRVSRWFMTTLALLPVLWFAWVISADLRARLGSAITVVVTAVALFALHRALEHAEARGWIYYRRKRGSYGGLGVTSEWLNMYDPSRKHLQQAQRVSEWKRDEDDDGDGPAGGSGRSGGNRGQAPPAS